MSRERIKQWIESRKVQQTITVLIIINAITIGFETSHEVMASVGKYLLLFDKIILAVFVIEILLKLYAWKGKFFTDGWNVFDFIVVAIALIPASGPLSILRALRILRSLRLFKAVPRLRLIIEALLHSLPSIGWIFILLVMLFYVFAVIGTKLFGAVFPEFFGTVGRSMYSLFQVMTLESWSMGIARPVMKEFPFAFLYFIPFILIATYTTLNIFIAIVVNTMSEIQQQGSEKEVREIGKIVASEHDSIREDLIRIKDAVTALEKRLNKPQA